MPSKANICFKNIRFPRGKLSAGSSSTHYCLNSAVREKYVTVKKFPRTSRLIAKRIQRQKVRSFGVIRVRISDPRSVWIMVHQRNRQIHDQSGFAVIRTVLILSSRTKIIGFLSLGTIVVIVAVHVHLMFLKLAY